MIAKKNEMKTSVRSSVYEQACAPAQQYGQGGSVAPVLSYGSLGFHYE